MPLQHFTPDNFLAGEDAVDMMNIIIDYANALEARLSALEHPPLQTTIPHKCNCPKTSGICLQHDVSLTTDYKCHNGCYHTEKLKQ